jgi:hypothetical protein
MKKSLIQSKIAWLALAASSFYASIYKKSMTMKSLRRLSLCALLFFLEEIKNHRLHSFSISNSKIKTI